jgi:hypothetical protein
MKDLGRGTGLGMWFIEGLSLKRKKSGMSLSIFSLRG